MIAMIDFIIDFFAWWRWVLFRLLWKIFVLLVLIGGGISNILQGWRMLDLSKFRIVAEPGYVRFDGGVGELGAGIVLLLVGLLLCWRWVRAWARSRGGALS
jgi:hypothetical protein